ncbi:MAG: hypothetical protein PVH40_08290 [Gemmatimonadales bacterium]
MVQLDGDTLVSSWSDDSTLAVALPQRPSGQYEVSVTLLADGRVGTDYVQVVGLRGARVADDLSLGGMIRWGAFEVLALAPRADGPVAINVHTGATRSFTGVPGLPHNFYLDAPGPSYEQGTAVISVEGYLPHAAWRLEPGPPSPARAVGCHPPPKVLYEIVEVAPGRCLGVWPDTNRSPDPAVGYVWTDGRSAPLSAIPYGFHPLLTFRFSPGGSRIIPVGWASGQPAPPDLNQWPVFDPTPQVTYFLAAKTVTGAAFSRDGDTLVVVAADSAGDFSYTDWSVRLYGSDDGRELARAATPDFVALHAVAVDPLVPRIYVLGNLRAADEAYALTVWSLPDLALVAWIEFPVRHFAKPGILVYGGSGGHIYYVALIGDWNSPLPGQTIRIYEFDLLYP